MIIYNKCEEIIYYVESHSFYVSELMMLCNHDIIFALEWFSKRITKKQKKKCCNKIEKTSDSSKLRLLGFNSSFYVSFLFFKFMKYMIQ
jgi:hypothetical protein